MFQENRAFRSKQGCLGGDLNLGLEIENDKRGTDNNNIRALEILRQTNPD